MENPLVSVIIPCYNTAEYLRETFNSLFQQTFSQFEIIAIDDGSQDNTLEVLNYFSKIDNRIKVLSQKNTYCVIARVNAISQARGKYLVCLDSDDKLAPEYLEKCVEIAESNPKLSIIYSEAELFGKKNEKWNLPEFKLASFLLANCIYITALIRKSDYDAVGGFDTQMTLLEDWELFISIIKHGGQVYKIPETLFFYRQRENLSSVSNEASNEKQSDNILKIYTKHYDFYKKNNIYMQNFFADFKYQHERREKKYAKPHIKWFYKWFKPKKYKKIYKSIQ